MAEKLKKAVRTFLGGVRCISLAPAPRRPRVRRGPARCWLKTAERLSRATEEVGRALAQQA